MGEYVRLRSNKELDKNSTGDYSLLPKDDAPKQEKNLPTRMSRFVVVWFLVMIGFCMFLRNPTSTDLNQAAPATAAPKSTTDVNVGAVLDKATSTKNSGQATIDQQTLAVIAPDHPEWNDAMVGEEFAKALRKIRDAQVLHEPFDHISVPNLFSEKFYKALMKELPDPSLYEKASYAGTAPLYNALHLADEYLAQNQSPHDDKTKRLKIPQACFKGNIRDHSHNVTLDRMRRAAGCWQEEVQLHSLTSSQGRTLTQGGNGLNASSYPLWTQAVRFAHSNNFTHTLYEKLSTPMGIPQWKRAKVEQDDKIELRNSAAIRIEPLHYHLTPHVDMFQKIVTWQFFHPESNELENRKVGTLFYKLRPPFRNAIDLETQLNPDWLDYSHFTQVKEQPVIPNYFFAFAPNNRSWHGASIEPTKMEGVNPHSRRTFLGFITSKQWNYHHFHAKDWAPNEYFI